MKILRSSLCLSICLAVSHSSGHSSLPLTLAKVAEQSEALVVGDIVSVRGVKDSTGEIWTRYKLRVSLVLSGEFNGSVLSFDCLGGEVGGAGVVHSGIPTFSKGERVAIFYDQDDSYCPVSGWEKAYSFLPTTPKGNQQSPTRRAPPLPVFPMTASLRGGK